MRSSLQRQRRLRAPSAAASPRGIAWCSYHPTPPKCSSPSLRWRSASSSVQRCGPSSKFPTRKFGYTQSGLDIGQETYAAFASVTAAGTHVCNVIVTAEEAHRLEHPLRITTAGAPPSPTIIERLERLERLGARVTHVYGLTEAYGPFTICEYQEEWDALPPAARATMIARQGVATVPAETPRIVDGEMSDVPWDGTTIGEIGVT